MAQQAAPEADQAQLTGPVVGATAIPRLYKYDLAAQGYVAEEFFLSGSATSYALDNGAGTKSERRIHEAIQAPFVTRLVVIRPTDPGRFNGTAVVEWLNVSGGTDAAPEWLYLHRHIMRQGMAWIGVSAQWVGVEGTTEGIFGVGIKTADPERYGSLLHPGDAFSYDIFTHAGRAVRSGSRSPLGPLVAKRLIAVGQSQSAMFMVTYVNLVDPIVGLYDGFLVHARGGQGADLSGPEGGTPSVVSAESSFSERAAERRHLPGEPIVDSRVPVITVQTESELGLMSGTKARHVDGEHTRFWEIAGASHFDTYGLRAYKDDGNLSAEFLAQLLAPADGPGVAEPVNSAPQQRYVASAALAHLERWIQHGSAAPHAPLLETLGADEADETVLTVDGQGNVLGGIRTPWVDVPTATLSGVGKAGAGGAELLGFTRVFGKEKLGELYPGGRSEYLHRFVEATKRSVASGFLLEADAAEIVALARKSWPGS